MAQCLSWIGWVVLRLSRRLTHLLQPFSTDGGGSTLRLQLSNDPPYQGFRAAEGELHPIHSVPCLGRVAGGAFLSSTGGWLTCCSMSPRNGRANPSPASRNRPRCAPNRGLQVNCVFLMELSCWSAFEASSRCLEPGTHRPAVATLRSWPSLFRAAPWPGPATRCGLS